MNQSYPVPPPELLDQWCMENNWRDIAIQAAQWGANQELEASLERLEQTGFLDARRLLRAARRSVIPEIIEVDGYTYQLVKGLDD